MLYNYIDMENGKFRRALQAYNLPNNSTATAIGERIDYRPRILMNGVMKRLRRTDNPKSMYAKKINEELIRRYETEKVNYAQQVRIQFQIREAKSQRGRRRNWRTATRNFTAYGTKATIQNEIDRIYENIRDKIEQESPYDTKDFDYEILGDATEIPDDVANPPARRPAVRNNRVVNVKMRETFMLKLDEDADYSWDTKTGKCVFDYLIYKYTAKDLRKKASLETKYEVLNDLFRDEENPNPLETGVSISMLRKFCQRYRCSMYAYDADDELVEFYKPDGYDTETKDHKAPLIFRCWNKHFYPIEDEKERKSKVLSACKKEQTTLKDADIQLIKEKKAEAEKKADREIICPAEDDEIVGNDFAIKWIVENKIIPFPIKPTNLYYDEGTIQKITYKDKIVLTAPVDENIRDYYIGIGKEYSGQGTSQLLFEIWEEIMKEPMNENKLVSKPNPAVRKALLADGVKYRTHYGTTRDCKDLLEMYEYPDEYDEETEIIETPIEAPLSKYIDGVKKVRKDKVVKKIKKEKPKHKIIEKMLIDGTAVATDIEKCYSSLLKNPLDNWIQFDFNTEPMEFNIPEYYTHPKMDLGLGLYFVETDDLTLLHQSNWYSNNILDKAKSLGIQFTIKYVLQPAKDEDNKNYFHKVIKGIITRTKSNPELTKLLINQITGCLGKTYGKKLVVRMNNNLEEIWDKFVIEKALNTEEIYLHPLEYDGEKFWIYGKVERIEWTSWNLPMYIQILDWSNMMLYDMSKKVGGEIIYRKTDCIVSIGGKIPPIVKPNSKDITANWGNIRAEDIDKACRFNYEKQMKTQRHIEDPVICKQFKYYDLFDSNDWDAILKVAFDNGGLLVQGRAGTGKTHIINEGRKQGKFNMDKTLILSFTNRAARNIGGTTIHKAMCITEEGKTNNKTIEGLKDTELVIVDEISMINAHLWSMLDKLKKVSGATFILIGDHRQCPPIEDYTETNEYYGENYFCHPVVKYLANYNAIELNVRKRYDKALWDYLEDFYERDIIGNQIPRVKKSELKIEDILNKKNICYYNKTRDYVNDLCMDWNKKKLVDDWVYLEFEREDEKKDKQKSAYIYEGLPIMAIVNNKDLDIINSEEFVVLGYDAEKESMLIKRVDDDGRPEFELEWERFHKFFVVNYCATTHKSQGATISQDINVWDWNAVSRDRNIGYTALSRAKNINQLSLVIMGM